MNVLILGAHADDDVLGMGGTIAWHALIRGDNVTSVVVTDSSSAQYPGDTQKSQQKCHEARCAAKVLGIRDFHHMSLPDMRLDTVPHIEINAIVEQFIEDLQPELVYCPHPDVNKDHCAVFDSVMVATRPIPGQAVRTVCTYKLISSTEWASSISGTPFIPNRYVDIEQTLIFKLMAMNCYGTELRDYPHPRSLKGIRAYAAAAGVEVGVRFAEPLCIVRHLDLLTSPEERTEAAGKLAHVYSRIGAVAAEAEAIVEHPNLVGIDKMTECTINERSEETELVAVASRKPR